MRSTPVRDTPLPSVTLTTEGFATGSVEVAASTASVSRMAVVGSITVRGSSVANDQRENRLLALNVAIRIAMTVRRQILTQCHPADTSAVLVIGQRRRLPRLH